MPETGEGNENLLADAVAAERREIGEVLDRLGTEAEVTDPGERRRIVDQLMKLVDAHAARRRDVLYPRVSRDVPDGESIVDLATIGLDQIERTRTELAELSGTEPTFQPLVVKLEDEIWDHLEEERSDILPQLVDAIGTYAANELGEEFTRAGAGVSPT
jgi:Hemerythrin HHE cation binding domain